MDIQKLNEEIRNTIHETFQVEPGDTINMTLDYFSTDGNGVKRFELDGIEFYQSEYEDIDNAVEVCIDEEFFPEWVKNNDEISGFQVNYVDYIDGEESGDVQVLIY